MAARFLIELTHELNTLDCARAVEAVLKSGSHLLTHADWGCRDGEHKAWAIVELESKDEARAIVPPALRSKAKIVQLNYFAIDEIENILRTHQTRQP